MARPLRIEFAGACYHVINRGNFRFPVFREDRDRELVLRKLAEFAETFRVRIRAYCIQPNHLHLYLQTQEDNLSRFMQSFSTSFCLSYNRIHQTSGHVFQGRYKAFLVEDRSTYGDRVSRYIHLNPANTRSMRTADISVRRDLVRGFPWSSYGAIIGLRPCPRWLDGHAVLSGFPGKPAERQQAYATYVEQGLTLEIQAPHEAAAAQAIIGSDSFIERVRRGLTTLSENVNLRRESGQHRALSAWRSLDDVIGLVADRYGCDPADLVCPKRRAAEDRQVLLYLAATYCRGRQSLTELAEALGNLTVGGLCAARYRMARRLDSPAEVELRQTVNGLVDAIAGKTRE